MALVCINKSDLNEDNTRQIERYCLSQKVEVAAKIPFDDVVTEAVIRGVPVPEYSRGRVAQGIESLWQRISQVV
jgi:MinD superfamily P-loop ATPase